MKSFLVESDMIMVLVVNACFSGLLRDRYTSYITLHSCLYIPWAGTFSKDYFMNSNRSESKRSLLEGSKGGVKELMSIIGEAESGSSPSC